MAAQIDAVFDDLRPHAVKIGMLASAELVRTVAEGLRRHRRHPHGEDPPVVLDPVMVAKSGDPLLADDAVAALLGELVPLATLVTPNLPEARRMTGLPVDTAEERLAAARRIAELGPAVLLKGGHGEGDVVEDLLVAGGEVVGRYRNPRIETRSTHGTGCTLSSAIAARLGQGHALPDAVPHAVRAAIEYLRGAMAAARPMGEDPETGHGPVDHLYRLFAPTSGTSEDA